MALGPRPHAPSPVMKGERLKFGKHIVIFYYNVSAGRDPPPHLLGSLLLSCLPKVKHGSISE